MRIYSNYGTLPSLIDAKNIVERMMLDPEHLITYKQDIDEIIKMDLTIKENEKQIKGTMEKMMGYSLLPGTKCRYLKSA
jgi:hypothetical protein